MNNAQIKSQMIGYVEQHAELKNLLESNNLLPHNMSIKEHLKKITEIKKNIAEYILWIKEQPFYADIILIAMQDVAEHNNISLSITADKIALAKTRLLNAGRCPCDADNPERRCISKLCLSDIENDGKCHCGAFIKK